VTAVTRLHRAAGPMTLVEASRRFLRRDAFEPTTRDTYGRTLAALVEVVGADADVAAVTTEQLEDDLFDARWVDIAATTYNRHRAALLSFFGWCIERGWAAANPVALVEPRKPRKRSEQERRERPIDRDLLAELWTLDGVAGRDRLFWRMAYETWARADELLGMNIEDLDPGRREGHVHGKGGDVETVWWATGTARLLPRVSAGRTTGPLFLAARRPTKPMPAADVDPVSGRARLSYRQAERLFGEVGRQLDPDGAPWTLHRLRHAGIAHAVSDGWNLAQVRAKSRHSSLRSLEVYANPSADSIREMTDALDSDARRPRGRPAAGGAR
jgi:integrase